MYQGAVSERPQGRELAKYLHIVTWRRGQQGTRYVICDNRDGLARARPWAAQVYNPASWNLRVQLSFTIIDILIISSQTKTHILLDHHFSLTMLLALLASGLPLVAGLATPAVRQPASSSVLVSLFVDKVTKASSVILTDKTKTKIYGHSCTSTLALGSLNVAYNVDQYGVGKLDLGPKTYTVHSDATVSGGVECGVIYDDTELHVDCLAPWTADFQLVELPVNATLPCFENHVSRRSAYGMDEEVYEPFVSGEVEARQAGSIGSITCNPIARTRLVGNGDPHQNYRHTQLSVSFSAVVLLPYFRLG